MTPTVPEIVQNRFGRNRDLTQFQRECRQFELCLTRLHFYRCHSRLSADAYQTPFSWRTLPFESNFSKNLFVRRPARGY
jgi:hypothetical protein